MKQCQQEKGQWLQFWIGIDEFESVTDAVSADGDAVQLANLNCPGQIVISGTEAG